MPRTEESNQRIREEQKRKIMLAATKVFAHKGLAATKMADIATEAGIGCGIAMDFIYFDFPPSSYPKPESVLHLLKP